MVRTVTAPWSTGAVEPIGGRTSPTRDDSTRAAGLMKAKFPTQTSRACDKELASRSEAGRPSASKCFQQLLARAIECDILSATPSARFNWLRPELDPEWQGSRRQPGCNIRS